MSAIRDLFVPKRLNELAPGVKLVVYAVLLFWTAVVLFPLYWVVITSFKLPIDVADGPNYLPFVDFPPACTPGDTSSSTLGGTRCDLMSIPWWWRHWRPCSLPSLARWRLTGWHASNIVRPWPRWDLSSCSPSSWQPSCSSAREPACRLPWVPGQPYFCLLVRVLQPALQAAPRQPRHPVLDHLPAHLAAGGHRTPDLLDVQGRGLLDTRTALVITYATVNLPIVVWLMFDFFSAMPKELEESAQIDGATRFGIFFDIALPLAGRAGRHDAAGPHPVLERVSARPVPLDRQRADDAAPGSGAERDAGTAVVVHVGPDRHHDRSGHPSRLLLQRFITRGLLVGAIKG